MFYTIQNGSLQELDTTRQADGVDSQYLGVIGYDEIYASAEGIGLKNTNKVFTNKNPRFEGHIGYDLMCFEMIDTSDILKPHIQFYVYIKKNLLLFIGDETDRILGYINSFVNDDIKELNFGRILAMFLDRMTEHDYTLTDTIEKEIIAVDDCIISQKNKDMVKHIAFIRKKLLDLKQYYQRLGDILEQIYENENDILDSRSLKVIKILTGRIDRMLSNVNNLSENVNHLRDAYQAQVDIELNRTMKVLTVLTAVCLPLTIITGWYGMNLKMPEYSLSFGYPLIIGIAIIVIGLIMLIFKKNKWM